MREVEVKSILNRHKKRDDWFLDDYSVSPFLSDSKEQIEDFVISSKERGAEYIYVGPLTLFGKNPGDCKVEYYRFLEENYPELVGEYRKHYRIFPVPGREYERRVIEIVIETANKYGVKFLPEG